MINLATALRFNRVPGETYTFRATHAGDEVTYVFEPDQPFEIPEGRYTFVSLFAGRRAEGPNLLPTGTTIKAQ